ELGSEVERHGVTTLWLTAGLFHQMIESSLDSLRSVRQLLAGGDLVSPRAVARALAGLPGTVVINGYGPTEGTTFTCCHRMAEPSQVETPVPVGRPIANTAVYVLDAALAPVPLGGCGTLYAGGDGVTRGYLGRPEQTAQRFVPDPFSHRPGARLYDTGDLASWRPAGEIEFLGRIDRQVKVRGFRVEPGEVEALLAAQPGVREAVVLVREGTPEDRHLVAYVVTGVGKGPDERDLRESLKRKLPGYMIPAAFFFLGSLPLTPTGKLDRVALSAMQKSSSDEAGYVAPRSPVEEILVSLWEEVLGRDRVGVHDDFFALGGHSLLATRLVSRMRGPLGVELPLRRLFEAPTVSELAQAVESVRRAGRSLEAPPLRRVPRTAGLPLSFSQERLWLVDQIDPGSLVYNLPLAARLTGALDLPALERSLGEVVRRHEALRTSFPTRDGSPVQEIAPFAGFVLPWVDLGALPETARRSEARRAIHDLFWLPFDLARGPLARFVLLMLGPEESFLAVALHHIVSDGWSTGVMVREISVLYGAFHGGRPSPLPELAVQYADYAVWQRRWLSGAVLGEQLVYWRSCLDGAPAELLLPVDRRRPAQRDSRAGVVSQRLAPELKEGLAAACRRQGMTLFMILLAALQAVLVRSSGQDDVVIGTPIANRTREEIEGLIGFFVNTLALRTDLSADPGFGQLLGRVREVALGAYAHQDLPFERLVAEIEPERDLGRSPLFQVMFALQNAPAVPASLAALELELLESAPEQLDFDLDLAAGEWEGEIYLHLGYSVALFDRVTMVRLLERFERLLAAGLAAPATPLSRLPLLSPGEHHQVLIEWSGLDGGLGATPTVEELFTAQVRRAPAALAVIAGEERLTYEELLRRASLLAGRLERMGVSPDIRVGLLLERSSDLIAAIFGVLLAGGAYVPFSPDDPAGRFDTLVVESQVALVVTRPEWRELVPWGVEVLELADGEWGSEAAGAEPSARALPDHLAYLLFTSGSTGRPKGVMIHRGAVTDFALRARDVYGLTATDRVLQFA
ncbi:MAG TPA: condensation domain-containing protein, partial [Thermoanaerobaculia bacterium]